MSSALNTPKSAVLDRKFSRHRNLKENIEKRAIKVE